MSSTSDKPQDSQNLNDVDAEMMELPQLINNGDGSSDSGDSQELNNPGVGEGKEEGEDDEDYMPDSDDEEDDDEVEEDGVDDEGDDSGIEDDLDNVRREEQLHNIFSRQYLLSQRQRILDELRLQQVPRPPPGFMPVPQHPEAAAEDLRQQQQQQQQQQEQAPQQLPTTAGPAAVDMGDDGPMDLDHAQRMQQQHEELVHQFRAERDLCCQLIGRLLHPMVLPVSTLSLCLALLVMQVREKKKKGVTYNVIPIFFSLIDL